MMNEQTAKAIENEKARLVQVQRKYDELMNEYNRWLAEQDRKNNEYLAKLTNLLKSRDSAENYVKLKEKQL